MYAAHEAQKKKKYSARALQVEKASFTPLVFSTIGGMGVEAEAFLKMLAKKRAQKAGEEYANVITLFTEDSISWC